MKLSKTYEEIKHKLEYFTCLDTLQQKLSNPALSVTSDTFYGVLDKLDACIEYINNNVSNFSHFF